MKTIIKILIAMAAAASVGFSAHSQDVATKNVDLQISETHLTVSADIVLDSLYLRSNRQIFITPIVRNGNEAVLPSLLVSGRNMHISYQRGVLRNFEQIKDRDIWKEVERHNGKKQTVEYSARIPLQDWMCDKDTKVAFSLDTCGCGALLGKVIREIPREIVIPENVANMMNSADEIPDFLSEIVVDIEDIPIRVHQGSARVQFEVDRTGLHIYPYVCKNGQRIDNREQLKIIDDSVNYALSDPNVELVGIELVGYASPESPYLHNKELADGRCKVLAEYLADRYNLPRERATYSSVPENWGEFRKKVEKSKEITELQRAQLLELIDAPATTPAEFDQKEKILKTDPKFAKLYKTKILPEWFPELRATTFALHTRLKQLDDAELAKVIESTPELMSLSQMYRVAKMYEPGSDQFKKVMQTAMEYYPDAPINRTNAAAEAIQRQDYDKAKQLLQGIPATPAVYNLLGIIATAEEDYEQAEYYFNLAGDYPTAKQNLNLLQKRKTPK